MSGHSILILEDDRGSAETYELMLRSRGHLVRTFPDVAHGLRDIGREMPCAAIVDLHLSVSDGMQFVHELRNRHQLGRLPIALVTGDYMVEERVTGELDALGVPLLFKPLWLEDLEAVVERLVSRCGNCLIAAK